MPNRKRRNRSLTLDFLEQRLAPVTITGKPMLTPQFIGPPIAVIGSGVITGQIRQPDGSMFASATVGGRSTLSSEFTGQFRITIQPNGPPIVAQAYLKSNNGTNVRLTITLTETAPNSDKFYFGEFTIDEGLGGGTASVATGPAENSFRFILKGEVAPP